MGPLVALAAAAAVASPVLGTGPHQKGVRVLNPATLKPVAGGPRLPKDTQQVELSPDGRKIAAATSSGLRFFSRATGRPSGRMRVQTGHRVLSWLAPDRLALIKRGKPTAVRIVKPSARKVVHREVRARLSDTARVGDRQVLLTAEKSGDEQRLSVFDSVGTLERTVALPGMVEGSLHGRSPIEGKALVLAGSKPLVYEVDVATGAVTRHDLELPEGGLEWLEPQRGDLLAVHAFGSPVFILDPTTFSTVRTVETGGRIEGAGPGFLSYGLGGDSPVSVYDASGDRLWSAPKDVNLLDVIAFGNRVYAGSGYEDVKVRIFNLRTGRKLATLPGRASLFEASFGRVDVPFFSSAGVNED